MNTQTIGPSLQMFGKHIMGFSGLFGAGALSSGGGDTIIAHICVWATVVGYGLVGLGMSLDKYYGVPEPGTTTTESVTVTRIEPTEPKKP